MEEIHVDPRNSQFASLDGVLFTKDMKTLIAYPTGSKSKHYTIPDTVETIGNGAFGMRAGYYMGPMVSSSQYCLETVSFPNSLRVIENNAFDNQQLLRDLRLPRSIESLGNQSFSAVKSFSCIEIPTTVNRLLTRVFDLLEPQHEVYFLGAPPPGNINNFYFPVTGTTIYYPAALAYAWAPNGETTYGGYNIAPYSYLMGDANLDGSVNVADAAAILRHLAGLTQLYLRGEAVADVDGDGQITTADAAMILRYLAGLVDSF